MPVSNFLLCHSYSNIKRRSVMLYPLLNVIQGSIIYWACCGHFYIPIPVFLGDLCFSLMLNKYFSCCLHTTYVYSEENLCRKIMQSDFIGIHIYSVHDIKPKMMCFSLLIMGELKTTK